MNRKLFFVFIIFIAAAASCMSFVMGRQATRLVVGPLAVEAKYLDLGTLSAVESHEYSFPLTNIGTDAVLIKDIVPACRCSEISLRQFMLKLSET
ncbi:hypothetical protein [Symmachiella dynata]|uniref:hypothetical protein n=1 Tax=Symmachiella dynata TaxID=2527995 RepID=UPI0030ECD89C